MERAKVKTRDAKVAELQDECATNWASGYFVFQEQAMEKYPGQDFDLDPP